VCTGADAVMADERERKGESGWETER